MHGPVLLRQYLTKANLTPAEFCRNHDSFCESEMSRYLAGAVVPGLAKAFELERATGGHVTAKSWVNPKSRKRRSRTPKAA